MPISDAKNLEILFRKAETKRKRWENLWQECYEYTQPHRTVDPAFASHSATKKHHTLYDSTACDAVDQLAASLLAELTPPWSDWFGLQYGNQTQPGYLDEVNLSKVADTVRKAVSQSNLVVELHQAFLDLVTVGTSCILVENSAPGAASPLKFTAIPTHELYIDSNAYDKATTVYRRSEVHIDVLRQRFPEFRVDENHLLQGDQTSKFAQVIEAFSQPDTACEYHAICKTHDGNTHLLSHGQFPESPALVFRWNKAAGEVYGRSPTMTALADIKTANKVVELILKNASISATGIWLAEDDGIINPRNIKLTPGTIIPKAVGSKGLTPLQAPGRFDVSQLVLQDLRTKIRHALLVDRLGAIGDRKMTATEVVERSVEMNRLLGAVFGRLQYELLQPLLHRIVSILQRRGTIPMFELGSYGVEVTYKSPLARSQSRADVGNVLFWLDAIGKTGGEANDHINRSRIVKWMAEMLGVPSDLLNNANLDLQKVIDKVSEGFAS